MNKNVLDLRDIKPPKKKKTAKVKPVEKVDVIEEDFLPQEEAEKKPHLAESLKPKNTDRAKRFILVGSMIQDKKMNKLYVRASQESFEEWIRANDPKGDFSRNIKLHPSTLVELYGLNPEECYFLESMDRKWEYKARSLPQLPTLSALMDNNYSGKRESLGIR